MDQIRRLWWGLALLLAGTFGVLLFMGNQVHLQAPPMPEQVTSDSGRVLFTRAQIEEGRLVWQRSGGQELGSIWGHGALVAPDWSADWLHREAQAWLDLRAQRQYGKAYEALTDGERAKLQAELKPDIRANRYDAASGTLRVTTSGRRRSMRWRRITAACSATTRRPRSCARSMR
jgi:nitric oxide reductase subunit B